MSEGKRPAFKREKALEFGATHAVESSDEAQALVDELTWGRGANVVVNTMGVGEGEQIGKSLAMAAKRGTVVVTNLHRATEETVTLNALDLVLTEKNWSAHCSAPPTPGCTFRSCSASTAAAISNSMNSPRAHTSSTRSTTATRTCATAAIYEA